MAEDALSDESIREEQALRWKCAIGIGVIFIALISYCWVGCAARDFIHWSGKQWENLQEQFRAKPQSQSSQMLSRNQLMPNHDINLG